MGGRPGSADGRRQGGAVAGRGGTRRTEQPLPMPMLPATSGASHWQGRLRPVRHFFFRVARHLARHVFRPFGPLQRHALQGASPRDRHSRRVARAPQSVTLEATASAAAWAAAPAAAAATATATATTAVSARSGAARTPPAAPARRPRPRPRPRPRRAAMSRRLPLALDHFYNRTRSPVLRLDDGRLLRSVVRGWMAVAHWPTRQLALESRASTTSSTG